MLSSLLNVPKTREDWDSWSLSHRDSHMRISQAVKVQKNISLIDYQLDPISPNDVRGFLDRNSQAHKDMNTALGTQGSDLQDVDFNKPEELNSWMDLHYLEHYDAEQDLKI